jgi:hypothetical protein
MRFSARALCADTKLPSFLYTLTFINILYCPNSLEQNNRGRELMFVQQTDACTVNSCFVFVRIQQNTWLKKHTSSQGMECAAVWLSFIITHNILGQTAANFKTQLNDIFPSDLVSRLFVCGSYDSFIRRDRRNRGFASFPNFLPF